MNLLPADNPSKSAIAELFNSMDNFFSHLNSESKWKKYFREKWDIVEPAELRLGVRYDTRRNSKTGTCEQVPIYLKSHPLFSSNTFALQIQLYYDDFECANPLGSKKGIHRFGCLYFILRNLPPRVNSTLLYIYLVSLFHAQDI